MNDPDDITQYEGSELPSRATNYSFTWKQVTASSRRLEHAGKGNKSVVKTVKSKATRKLSLSEIEAEKAKIMAQLLEIELQMLKKGDK